METAKLSISGEAKVQNGCMRKANKNRPSCVVI
jgi:hypothetical protein